MRALPETFTTVLAGAWNKHIFSPDWISTHLASERKIDAELGLTPSAVIPRFIWGGLVLVPTSQMLTIGIKADLSLWKETAKLAQQILTLLSHTPVSGVGVNFGFRAEVENDSPLAKAFELHDDADLIRTGGTVVTREVYRRLEYADTGVLNLRVQLLESSHVNVHLNYHTDVERATDAAEAARRYQEVDLFSKATALLHSAYGVQLSNE